MNNHVNNLGHQQWYGANQNYGPGYQGQQQQANAHFEQPPGPPPSQAWAPYSTMPGRTTRRRRRCDMLYSVLRHVSPIVPFIMIIIVAYIYIREGARYDGEDRGPDDAAWLPLYLVMPVSVANIIWSFAVMIKQRRATHRGRPVSQTTMLAVESILAVGGAVCFALLIVYIRRNASDRRDGVYYFPLSYEGAITWLLGVQMLANALLAMRAAYEMRVQRRQRDQHETYVVQ